MLQVSKRSKRLFAILVGLMMVVSQSSYLSLNKVYAETNDSGTTETVYVLTDTLEAGQNYIIANGDSGSVNVLEKDSRSFSSDTTEVITDGDATYIKAPSDDSVWTAVEGEDPSSLVPDEEEFYIYVESQIQTSQDEDVETTRGPPEEDDSVAVEEEVTRDAPATKDGEPAVINKPENTVLAFTSDTHNKDGNAAAIRLGTWLDKIAGIYGGVTLMAFGGDMANASATESAFWTLTQADMDQLSTRQVTGVYTTGNHEYSPGSYTNGKNDTTKKYVENTEGASGKNYRIYCLGSSAYAESSGGWGGWNQYSSSQISTLSNYLNSIPDNDNKVIFVITHYPLHNTSSRTISGASDVINTLNAAADKGKKIVYLWGHNHTDAPNTETNYDKIFKPGDKIQNQSTAIKFYYGAAGCMSDSEYGTGSGSIKGKGLVVTIDDDNLLSFKYYTADGTVVKDGTFSEIPATGVTIEESTEIGDDGQPVEHSVAAGKKLQLHVTFEPADATGTVSWSSDNENVATVDSNGKVTGVSEGTATITATLDTNAKASTTSSIVITVGPRGNDPTFVLTDTLDPNKNYIIANKNDGSAYALTNNNGSIGKTTVDVDDDTIVLEDEEAAENLVFTTEGSGSTVTAIGNNGRYISAANNSLTLATSAPTNRTFAYGTDSKLTCRSGNSTYYIYYSTYNNGNYQSSTSASSSSSPREVYLYEEVKEQVAVQSVTVDPTSKTIQERTSTQLTATVFPENATNKRVTWESSNTSVAKVDENGKVRGVGEGTATITVKSVADTTKYATATITVTPNDNPQPTYVIAIDGYAMSVNRSPNTANGGSSSYTYTGLAGVPYSSGDAATDEIRWIIEETTGGYYIQDLDGNYLNATYVSGNNSGTGNLKLDSTKDVWVLDSGVTFDENGEVDGTKLKSTNASNTASSAKYLSYEDSQNLFSVRSEGNADEISVIEAEDPVAVTGITVSPNEKTIKSRTTTQLTATVAPLDATNKKVTWESSDTAVASVDDNGVVRGVSEGTVTITAKSVSNPEITGTATIHVELNENPVPTYVITVGTNALSTVRSNNQLENNGSGSQKYYYTGLAGAAFDPDTTPADNIRWILEETTGGYYIKDYLTGNYLNATYTQNNTGGYSGDLKLDSTKDVWVLDGTLDSWEVDGSLLKSTNASSTASSAKYLAYEDNQNLFTVRSESSADTTTLVEAEDPVAVMGVSVDPGSATIEARKTVQLTATVTPEDATNKNVTWESSNTNIATVDENGLVRGVAEGDVEITVKTVDGNKTATCAVHVDPSTSADPDYIIVIDGYALSTDRSPNTAQGGSSSYTYTGLAGVEYATADTSSENIRWTIEETTGGYHIKSLDGRYLNATYTSGNNSGKGDLKLDSTPDVWVLDNGYSLESGIVDGSKLKSTNASATASNGDKFLSYEDGQNLFTVRSEGNADTITIVDSTYEIVERFVETDTLENDKEYIIVATKNAGSYAVQNVASGTSTGNTGSAVVTVNPASGSEAAYIETQDTTIVWKYASSNQYMSSVSGSSGSTTRYLGYESSTLLPRVSSQGRAITYNGGKLQIGSGNYLTCDNSGTFSTTTTETTGIRIFVKTVEIITCEHTYGEPEWTWTGDDENGYTAAKAKFICTKCGEAQTVDATVTEKATDTEKTYTATADFGGDTYTDTKTVALHQHNMVRTAANAATCDTDGNIEYWTCSVCNKIFKDEAGNEQITLAETIIPKLNHDWEFVDFTWTGSDTDGYTAAVANYKCKNNENHTQTVDATVTPVTTPATCEAAGQTVYTAEVSEGASLDGKAQTASKTVTIAALNHAYGEPEYTWSTDNKTVTAKMVCANDESHVISDTATVTSEVTKAATCEEKGETTYTATFTNTAFATQTKTVADIPALNHDWEFVDFTWTGSDAEGYTAAVANYKCKNDENHTQTVDATVTPVTTPATCEAAGQTVYTAEVSEGASLDGNAQTASKTVEIPKLNHDWEFTGFTWTGDDTNGYTAAVANYKCKNDAGHTQSVAAEFASTSEDATCTQAGTVTYTASVSEATSLDGAVHNDSKEVTGTALGHEWGEVDYVWKDDNSSVTATRVCARDANHFETETVNTTSEVTKKATCEAKGETTYTAEFTNEAFGTKTKTVENIDALGHNWAFDEEAGENGFTWTGDDTNGYTAAVAHYKCTRDPDHTNTVDAVITNETVPATCTEDGTVTYTATVSKDNSLDGAEKTASKTITIGELGHLWKFVDFTWTGSDAEGYTAAVANYECTRDTGHTTAAEATVTSETTPATCEEAGKTVYTATVSEGASPTNEGKTETKTVTIAALGHDWSEWTVTKEATCTEKGEKSRKCQRDGCGETETAEIAELGHDWGEWTVTKEATCTEKGEKSRKCQRDGCGETETAEIAELGHDWGEWTVTKEATTSATGEKVRKCSRCDEEQTEVIPKKTSPTAAVSGTLLATMKSSGSNNLAISWTPVKGAQGYDVFLSPCGTTSWKVYSTSANNYKFNATGLKAKTAYKAVIKAYVMKDGKKSYVRTAPDAHAYTSGGDKKYTNPKSVKVKKSKLKVKVGKSVKIKASVKKLKKSKKLIGKGHGPQLRYISTNTKIATVNGSGKVIGKSKGTCTIYVYAINGIRKSVKVTVK